MDGWMDGLFVAVFFAAGAVFVQQTEPLNWLDLTDVNTEWKPQINDWDIPD